LVEHIIYNDINYRLFMVGQFLLIWPGCRHNPHNLGANVLSTSSSISVLMRVLLGRPFFSLCMSGLWQSSGPMGANNSCRWLLWTTCYRWRKHYRFWTHMD